MEDKMEFTWNQPQMKIHISVVIQRCFCAICGGAGDFVVEQDTKIQPYNIRNFVKISKKDRKQGIQWSVQVLKSEWAVNSVRWDRLKVTSQEWEGGVITID